MKKITIAFDVDGTLIKNEDYWVCNYIPNKRICHLLEILAWFKNVDIIVWSGGGKEHAEKAVKMCNLEKFVPKNKCFSKNYIWKENWKAKFNPPFKVDIAIDDIHSCDLGMLNLIVREK